MQIACCEHPVCSTSERQIASPAVAFAPRVSARALRRHLVVHKAQRNHRLQVSMTTMAQTVSISEHMQKLKQEKK